MTIHYVDSAAGGANDGTSWTDAWTSISSATGVAAGDTVLVDDGHSESGGAGAWTLTWANGTILNPVKIIVVDKADDSLSTGAVISVTTNQLYMGGNIYVYGLTIQCGYSMRLSSSNKNVVRYESCTFKQTTTSGGSSFSITTTAAGDQQKGAVYLVDCVIDHSSRATANVWGLVVGKVNTYIKNLTFSLGSTNPQYMFYVSSVYGPTICEIYDSDLSGFNFADFASGNSNMGLIRFFRCKTKSGAVAANVEPVASKVIVENCDDGTITVPPLGVTYLLNYWGTVSSSLTVYRTGGADDSFQANAYSLQMATNANALEIYNPLEITLASRVIDAAASPSGATAQGIFTSTRCEPLATPVVLDRSTGTVWEGTGTGVDGGTGQQKIDHVLTNGDTLTVYVASGADLYNDEFWIEVSEPDQVGGLMTVRACLAIPSTTVYVDPKIEVA